MNKRKKKKQLDKLKYKLKNFILIRMILFF